MVLLFVELFKVSLLNSEISVFKDKLICIWWWLCYTKVHMCLGVHWKWVFHSIFQITSNSQSNSYIIVRMMKTRKRLESKTIIFVDTGRFSKKNVWNILFYLRLVYSRYDNWLTAQFLQKLLTLLTILCDTFMLVNVVSSGLILS